MGRGDGAVAKRLWVKKLCSNNSYTLTQSSPPPRDRWNVVYVCMLMAGAGFIFPWSSYVTAIDYFFFLYWKDFRLVNSDHVQFGLISHGTGFSGHSYDIPGVNMVLYRSQHFNSECCSSTHAHWTGLCAVPHITHSHTGTRPAGPQLPLVHSCCLHSHHPLSSCGWCWFWRSVGPP